MVFSITTVPFTGNLNNSRFSCYKKQNFLVNQKFIHQLFPLTGVSDNGQNSMSCLTEILAVMRETVFEDPENGQFCFVSGHLDCLVNGVYRILTAGVRKRTVFLILLK